MTSSLTPPSLNSSNRSKQSIINGNRVSASASPSDGFHRDLGPPTPNTEEDVPHRVVSRKASGNIEDSASNPLANSISATHNDPHKQNQGDDNIYNNHHLHDSKNQSSGKFSSFIKKLGANLKSEVREGLADTAHGLRSPVGHNYLVNSQSVGSVNSSTRVAWDGSFLSPAMTDQPQLTQQSCSRRHWFQSSPGSTPSSVLESQLFYRDFNSPHSVFRTVSAHPASRSTTHIQQSISPPRQQHRSLRKRLRQMVLGESDSPFTTTDTPIPLYSQQPHVPETDIAAAQSLSKDVNPSRKEEGTNEISESDNEDEKEEKPTYNDEQPPQGPKTAEEMEAEVNPGLEHWLEQRRKWTTPKKGLHITRSTFAEDLDEQSYPKVYRLLIDNQRRLRQPMRLGLALKIIQAGWVATGQWPLTPSTESTAALAKK